MEIKELNIRYKYKIIRYLIGLLFKKKKSFLTIIIIKKDKSNKIILTNIALEPRTIVKGIKENNKMK